jgi:hypothetical protein
MNPVIIAKYRLVKWCFAVYEGIELQEVYVMDAERLEPYFKKWQKKWEDEKGKDINNPKIPLTFIRKHGSPVFTATERPAAVEPQSLGARPRDPEEPDG